MTHKGIVKWFNNSVKYGFIVDENGIEIFVHFSEIVTEGYKTLKRGEAVVFEIAESEKGKKAVHVVRLKDGAGKKTFEKENPEHTRRSA